MLLSILYADGDAGNTEGASEKEDDVTILVDLDSGDADNGHGSAPALNKKKNKSKKGNACSATDASCQSINSGAVHKLFVRKRHPLC